MKALKEQIITQTPIVEFFSEPSTGKSTVSELVSIVLNNIGIKTIYYQENAKDTSVELNRLKSKLSKEGLTEAETKTLENLEKRIRGGDELFEEQKKQFEYLSWSNCDLVIADTGLLISSAYHPDPPKIASSVSEHYKEKNIHLINIRGNIEYDQEGRSGVGRDPWHANQIKKTLAFFGLKHDTITNKMGELDAAVGLSIESIFKAYPELLEKISKDINIEEEIKKTTQQYLNNEVEKKDLKTEIKEEKLKDLEEIDQVIEKFKDKGISAEGIIKYVEENPILNVHFEDQIKPFLTSILISMTGKINNVPSEILKGTLEEFINITKEGWDFKSTPNYNLIKDFPDFIFSLESIVELNETETKDSLGKVNDILSKVSAGKLFDKLKEETKDFDESMVQTFIKPDHIPIKKYEDLTPNEISILGDVDWKGIPYNPEELKNTWISLSGTEESPDFYPIDNFKESYKKSYSQEELQGSGFEIPSVPTKEREKEKGVFYGKKETEVKAINIKHLGLELPAYDVYKNGAFVILNNEGEVDYIVPSNNSGNPINYEEISKQPNPNKKNKRYGQ